MIPQTTSKTRGPARIWISAFLGMIFVSGTLFSQAGLNLKREEKEEISQGPLKISAQETLSRDRGKWIEAKGDVRVNYDMELGDRLESFSQFASYNEKDGRGEIWGNPKAIWKRKNPSEPETELEAEKIILKIKESELYASGRVWVAQTSSTLCADEIAFANREKKMTAKGGRPEFTIRQTDHFTKISSDEIVAWTEKRQIQFSNRVQGKVLLNLKK